MRLLLLFAAIAVATTSQAQMILTGQLRQAKPDAALVINVPYDCWFYPENSLSIKPDSRGQFSVRLPVRQPQTIFLDYAGKRLYLYAEPDQTLSVVADASGVGQSIRFGGGLRRENELRQRIGLTTYQLGVQTWNDSLTAPAEILSSLKQQQQTAFEHLKTAPADLSARFRRMTEADIRYFATSKLWDLIWQNGVWTQTNQSKHDRDRWREALINAHDAVPLSNDDALESYHYQQTIAYYPRYLQHRAASKEEFVRFVEPIFKKSFADINRDLREKGERYWEYTALNHGLTGCSLDRAIASFLINGLQQGDLDYQQEAYADYRQRFPSSTYLPRVQEFMKPYLASVAKASTALAGIQFVADSLRLPTLDSLLATHRGRVVYVDMWGTWCGPCRQEFAHNQALKDWFKDQPVDFVYVAVEHRPSPEKHWREVVAFYNLTGQHVLAGKALEASLRNLYASNGTLQFPSYILVDKTGKIVTLYGKRPSDKEELYRQIEQLL